MPREFLCMRSSARVTHVADSNMMKHPVYHIEAIADASCQYLVDYIIPVF